MGQLQIENTSRLNINIEGSFRQQMTFFSRYLRLNYLKILVSQFQGTIFPKQSLKKSKKTIVMTS